MAADIRETIVQQGAGALHGELARETFGFGGDAHRRVGFAIHIDVAVLAHGGMLEIAAIGAERQPVGGVLDCDAEPVDMRGTLAQGGPVIPTVLGFRRLGEDGAEQAAELAFGDGAAGLLIREMRRTIVDTDELIVFLTFEVSELQHESVRQMPLFPALGVFVALDGFRTDEIRQRRGVTERLLPSGVPDALLFAGPRRTAARL